MGKTHLKSEHTGCKIIKALLQMLHNTFLYQLLLQDTGKQHSSLDKRHGTLYQLRPVNTGASNTNPQKQGHEHSGQRAGQVFHPLRGAPQPPCGIKPKHPKRSSALVLPWCRRANIPSRSCHVPDVSPTLCSKSAGNGPGPDPS